MFNSFIKENIDKNKWHIINSWELFYHTVLNIITVNASIIEIKAFLEQCFDHLLFLSLNIHCIIN